METNLRLLYADYVSDHLLIINHEILRSEIVIFFYTKNLYCFFSRTRLSVYFIKRKKESYKQALGRP
jgi:hypothetical protein